MSFAGSRSSDPDGDPLHYSWSFGDGGTSSAAAPAHRYSNSGTYTARLTVTDGLGGTATDTQTISADGTPGSGAPGTPGAPSPPGGSGPSDNTGPRLRLLGVNATRGRIRGSAADGSGVARVRVALRRRVKGGRCGWLLKKNGKVRLVRRRCDRPRWMTAGLTPTRAGARWLLALGRSIPPGSYRVLARASDVHGNASSLNLSSAARIRVSP